MPSKFYALVKWIGGEDDKKYTVGVPIDWILGFDYAEYMTDDHDVGESYVVEWRDPKKKPKGGWICYDCHVVFVSDKIPKLNSHLKILEGVKSPKVVDIVNVTPNKKQSTSKPVSPENKSPSNEQAESSDDPDEDLNVRLRQHRKRRLNFDSDGERERNKNRSSGLRVEFQAKNNKNDSGNRNDASDSETFNSPPKTPGGEISSSRDSNGQKKQIEKPTEEPTLADIMAELKSHKSAIETLQSDFVKFKQGKSDDLPARRPSYTGRQSGTSYKNARDLDDGEFVEGNVEIGPPGSGIFVTDMQWTSAISRGTYKSMATTLVTSLFPMDVLLKSNFKGGKSKLKKNDASCPRYDALDEKTIKAVMYSVRGMYPKTFTEVGVGQAINVKLTKLRVKRGLPEGDNNDSA